MQIKIAGITYDIVYKTSEEMNGLIGTADFNRQLISINKEHTRQTQEIALVHELLHIVSDAYGVGLTEDQIKILTHGLVAFYKDNEILDFRS
jgi:Zn-dependent peptidase ImmA (M78 family)